MKNKTPKEVNDIANLSFIAGRTNQKIANKQPKDYLSKIPQEELEKQCIPTNPDLWAIEQYDAFLSERRELIANKLNEFIGHSEHE